MFRQGVTKGVLKGDGLPRGARTFPGDTELELAGRDRGLLIQLLAEQYDWSLEQAAREVALGRHHTVLRGG